MDENLLQQIRSNKSDAVSHESQFTFRFPDESGTVELDLDGQQQHFHLKPLADLYGPGVIGQGSVDPLNDDYMPLFLAIEQGILRHYSVNPSLTDAVVELSLNRVAVNPESENPEGSLERHLQLDLRLLLSIHDYSRHDLRGALRKVAKSVSRHTSSAGPRGYLTFIRKQFKQ